MNEAIPFPTLLRNGILHANAAPIEKEQVLCAIFGR